jgi:hypothetical protein
MEKLESHMMYLSGSHVLRSWPIWLTADVKFLEVPEREVCKV